jgi:hypothetical protein
VPGGLAVHSRVHVCLLDRLLALEVQENGPPFERLLFAINCWPGELMRVSHCLPTYELTMCVISDPNLQGYGKPRQSGWLLLKIHSVLRFSLIVSLGLILQPRIMF